MAGSSKKVVPAAELDPAEVLEQVRDLVKSIKGFVFLKTSWRRRINSAATLPDPFYMLGSYALDANEWLAKTSNLSGAEIRDVLHFSGGVMDLAGELELLAKGLRSTVAARRADVGQRLLFAYAMARRHNKTPGAVIIPHVDDMERLLRARRRRRASKAEPEEPQEAPPPAEP